MKFGQLVEYNKRNIFLKNYAENDSGRLVPDLFIFLKKPLTSWLVSVWLTLYQIDPVMSTDTHNIHRFK